MQHYLHLVRIGRTPHYFRWAYILKSPPREKNTSRCRDRFPVFLPPHLRASRLWGLSMMDRVISIYFCATPQYMVLVSYQLLFVVIYICFNLIYIFISRYRICLLLEILLLNFYPSATRAIIRGWWMAPHGGNWMRFQEAILYLPPVDGHSEKKLPSSARYFIEDDEYCISSQGQSYLVTACISWRLASLIHVLT